jgi:hypothetical protein
MKRLIKADKYQDFVESWWNEWSGQNETVEQFIRENQDCVYKGEAYRSLGFKDLHSVIGDVEVEDNIDYNKLKDSLRKMIKGDSKNVSWSYNYSSVDDFANNKMENDFDVNVEVMICANISGLDMSKFVEKYKDNIDQSYMEGTDMEDEVIGKMESNFDIEDIYIRDLKNGIMKFNDDNPSIIKLTDTGYLIDYDN